MKLKLFVVIFFLLYLSIFSKGNDKTSGKRLNAFQISIKEESNKNYNKALKTILEIYNSNKSDYLMNLRLGWLYYLNKQNEKSLKYYKKAAVISNNSIESSFGLTYPYSEFGKWDSVISIYKNIISRDNLNYTANLKLGQIFISEKDYQKAKIILEKLHNNYPSDYKINIELGWVYYYLGDNRKSNYLFTNALIIDPGNETAKKGIELTK